MEPLFVVEPQATGELASIGSAALGASAEYEAIGLLLARGHRVAVPVVDDDGVDLIVDYRTTVQVKLTRQTTGRGLPLLNCAKWVRSAPKEQPVFKTLPSHVDVVLVKVGTGTWYVVPRGEIGGRRNLTFGPGMDQWREAWSVFA